MNQITITCPGKSTDSCLQTSGKSQLFSGENRAEILFVNNFDSDCELSAEFLSSDAPKTQNSSYFFQNNFGNRESFFQVHSLGSISAGNESKFLLSVERDAKINLQEVVKFSSKLTISCGNEVKILAEAGADSHPVLNRDQVEGATIESAIGQQPIKTNTTLDALAEITSASTWLLVLFVIILFLIWLILFYLLKKRFAKKNEE